jgi:uncharacterized protein YacL
MEINKIIPKFITFFYFLFYVQVHLMAAIMTPLVTLVAIYRIVETRDLLGVSLSKVAFAHRIMGWIAIVISLLLVVFGGFRFYNQRYRKISIYVHWALGMIYYLLGCKSNVDDLCFC